MGWLPWSLAADETESGAPAGAGSSSDLLRLASGCSAGWSPFCRLVGREAEAEAWAASKWRGLATAEAVWGKQAGRRGLKKETLHC